MFNFHKKTGHSPTVLYAPAAGNLMMIEQVKDPVFSQKLMGDGYAVHPMNGSITAPVNGTIMTIFPTKHAIGILTNNKEEVLLHMGINTVELDGIPFTLHVKEGDIVRSDQVLADVDLTYLHEHHIEPTIIVVFTNMNAAQQLVLQPASDVLHGQAIGNIQ